MDKNQIKEFSECMRRFLPMCMEQLDLDHLPEIVWSIDVGTLNGRKTFGTFTNEDRCIHISLRNRHPLDILRTLAHELTHYKQMLTGNIKPGSGDTGSRQENEANAMAGIIMRNFDHSYPDFFKMKPISESGLRKR